MYVPFIDIDECSNNTDSCDNTNGICINDVGSYHCKCKNGYKLSNDGKTCIGKHDICYSYISLY